MDSTHSGAQKSHQDCRFATATGLFFVKRRVFDPRLYTDSDIFFELKYYLMNTSANLNKLFSY